MMVPFQPKPGVNTLGSRLMAGTGWWACNLIRFKDGLLQKLGGWLRLTNTALIGVCRGLFAWTDLTNVSYLACGTTTNLNVYTNGALYDITVRRRTQSRATPFAMVAGSTEVLATDAGANASIGDAVYIPSRVSVCGTIVQGWYLLTSAPTSGSWTFDAAYPALTTSASAGTVPVYDTTLGSPDVTVTLPNHELLAGSTFTVGVSTAAGGLTLVGDYTVQSVGSANTFVITASDSATSTATVAENGGNVKLIYAAHAQTSGTVRNWWLDNWGEFLMSNYTNGPLCIWTPPVAYDNVSTVITQAPAANAGFFIAMPARIVVSFGCTDAGTGAQDAVLIRWSTVDDYTVWSATATNQAGSYRLPSGSYIVGAVQAPMQAFILTDIELWTMTYIGFPYIFSFQKVGWACGLVAPKAIARIGNVLIWMGRKEFFLYDGSQVRVLECPVWDNIFPLYSKANAAKIFAAVNSEFSEVAFFFPQSTSTESSFGSGNYGAGTFGGSFSANQATTDECGYYVKLNIKDNLWDYGTLVRTAWTDQSVLGEPIGVDGNGLLQQHEMSFDADGQQMLSNATTGWMKIANGGEFVYLDSVIPDFVIDGTYSVKLWVYTSDYTTGVVNTYGPFDIDPNTQYVFIGQRARFVSLYCDFSASGTFSRVGQFLLLVQPDGQQ